MRLCLYGIVTRCGMEATHPPFQPIPGRDAHATIRGYVYQVQHTLLAWLRIAPTQAIYCESGEDIDYIDEVGREIASGRVLAQIRDYTHTISLRTPAVREALAGFLKTCALNPDHDLHFCYLTTATAHQEQGVTFPGGRTGLATWMALRRGELSPTDMESAIQSMRDAAVLRSDVADERQPPAYARQVADYFANTATATLFDDLIQRVEFSLGNPNSGDMEASIRSQLREMDFAVTEDEAERLYHALFTEIFRLLSLPGEKRLDRHRLETVIASFRAGQPFDDVLERLHLLLTELSAQLDQGFTATQAVVRQAGADNRDAILESLAAMHSQTEQRHEERHEELLRVLHERSGAEPPRRLGGDDLLVPSIVNPAAVDDETDDRLAALHQGITDAAQPLLDGEPDVALGRLLQLRASVWDDLDARGRYRLLANLGNASVRRHDLPGAASYYHEAVNFQPEDPDAQALHAQGYLFEGHPELAFRVTQRYCPRFPGHHLLHALRIHAAPASFGWEQLLSMAAVGMRGNVNVAAALARRALEVQQYEQAELFALAVVATEPMWVEGRERLASTLLTIAQKCWADHHVLTDADRARVNDAIAILTDLIGSADTEVVLAARLNRSAGYFLLGNQEQAANDRQVAYALAPTNPDVLLRYATTRWQAGQHDEAILLLADDEQTTARPDSILTLAQWRTIRGQDGDLIQARVALEDLLASFPTQRDPVDEYLDTVELLINVYRQGEDFEDAKALLRAEEPYLSPVLHSYLNANVDLARESGHHNSGEEQLRVALALAATATVPLQIKIALLAEERSWWEEAIAIWRRLASEDALTMATQHLLACASRIEDDFLVYEVTRKLRENRLYDPQCFDLELDFLEHYHDLPTAQSLMETYLSAPTDPSLERQVLLRLALLAIRTGQDTLLAALLPTLPPVMAVDAQQGRAVVEVLRHGTTPEEAVDYAYRLWRRFPEDKAAFEAVIVSPNVTDGPPQRFLNPGIVGTGTAVGLRAPDQPETTDDLEWWVIEDEGAPRLIYREISPTHPLSVTLLGKAVGDTVVVNSGRLRGQQAIVQEILPKDVYRWRWCAAQQADHFPDDPTVEVIRIDPDDAAAQLIDRFQGQDAAARQQRDLYRQGHVPIAVFADWHHRSALEGVLFLANEPTMPVYAGGVTSADFLGVQEILRSSKGLVLDPTALGTLLAADATGLLAHSPIPLIVPASVLLRLRSIASGLRHQGERFTLMSTEQGVAIHEHSIEERERQANKLMALVATLEYCCEIASGIPLAKIPAAQRADLMRICGKEGAESVAIAAARGLAVWTDDRWSGMYAANR